MPVQRWANGTQRGVRWTKGSRPNMASAEISCTSASETAIVASQDFMAANDEKPRSKMRAPVASWTRL